MPSPCTRARCWRARREDDGFTLVELLIVVAVMPLIVGALSLGLISVFKLQSSVSNRLGDTVDSQVVESTFQNDVSSALAVTAAPGLSAEECGPSSETQLLGLAWSPYSTQQGGGYATIVTYAEVQNGSQWNLVRQYCTGGYSQTPATSTIVAYNIQAPCATGQSTGCQGPAQVLLQSGLDEAAESSWVPVVDSNATSNNVATVEFPLADPNATEKGGAYDYTLTATPEAAAPTLSSGGSNITVTTQAGCNFATPGTGYYASSMCLVDFSNLTGNNLLAAESGCLEMEVNLPGGSELYFCLSISGGPIEPYALPTWENGFLGNSCNASGCTAGTPFYTGIGGDPALYQTENGTTTTITISKISVLTAKGTAATGWWAVGADAESTDSGEYIQWTSDQPLLVMSDSSSTTYTYSQWAANHDSWPSDPVGNAYVNGTYLQYVNNAETVKGSVPSQDSIGLKTGTGMVETETPTTFTTTMYGTGKEAMAFGVLLS